MLQLGDFIWPNDPEKLTVSYCRKVDIDTTRDGLWSVTNIARLGRTFEGEGVFYGADAYATFSQLALYLYSGAAKNFVHPKWNAATVLLTELEVTEECQNEFLRYRFKLIETPS